MVKYSIITPTFNRAYIIGNTINSVLSQKYSDWEMVVVDDGSTDETEKITKDFNQARIKFYRQDHKGPSAARNLALEKATGDWMVYIDSDNELLPNYLRYFSKKK
jgi:glycosyltransferase involved in cell wall biosynthesis